ncbi:hypothetical protein [Paucibacter sp. XJ19-41]|uniref:hypothetical protein n=1 Tax=Paucibacter sp. XJ19-41 TaxID=2927824 RepID=UPI002349CDA2|nr:hypothetical protein [Paucibacter sp. XJ19-41]MDC6168054.1 hypothetical protein [Paucibacter sp. XJ19-41]
MDSPPARPELLDYVVFFETEPDWVHPEGWYYGVRFETTRGQDRIIATLAPDEAEFSFEWWQGDVRRLRVQSVLAVDWRIETTSTRELLRVGYNDLQVKFCELQLRPHVSIDWAMTW